VFSSRPPEFFAPIVCTLQHHFETQRPARFDARLQLLYVSRGASACLHQLFALFDEAGREGTQVRVHWAHDAADPPHASSGPSWRVAWPACCSSARPWPRLGHGRAVSVGQLSDGLLQVGGPVAPIPPGPAPVPHSSPGPRSVRW
jgi:hypothetical protein